MNSNEIRTKFLDFFAACGHKIVPSDSLIPSDDPTLLFTSAGMNQFKQEFLGKKGSFSRAATCQRCLRTDDLDKVGKTSFHHTFFEMLGNFSFGDYFKEDAISWAWEFLTKELIIPKEKLWASVYKEDDESYDIWINKIKLPKEKIIKFGDKENFWPSEAKTKGPNGPCGPCSEIFYDYGKTIGCGKKSCNPACSCGRFVEVWNLVFTQFNRKDDGALEALPHKNIDTGMGLERLAAVMQGVYNNFDADLFVPIIRSIKKEIDIAKPKQKQQIKIKIIADHIRAITFAICDGVNPSNEERGYVARKLIRIGVDNYRDLEVKKALLYKIVPAVVEVMKEPYPKLIERREDIAEIIKREEESYLKIIKELGPIEIEEFKEIEKKYPDIKERSIEAGKIAFRFHDTFGFSFATTVSAITINKVPVDLNILTLSFDQSMQEQKNRSRTTSTMGGDVFVNSALKLNFSNTEFKGYDNFEVSAKIIKIFDVNNKEINSTENKPDLKIILDKTPFYGESGGQVGDTGLIENDNGRMEVVDTKNIDGLIVHIVKPSKGTFRVNDKVQAKVDYKRRMAIARNHTATHLLQSALRKVLGQHVQQQGSLVSPDRLRFDFTHFKAISQQELDRIEEVVNEFIRNNAILKIKEIPLEEAKKSGALAFFADKYEDLVRVISIGDYSQELCGGTHLTSTGEIGLFKIVSENSIAQGIRRIEATTGEAAYKLIKTEESIIVEFSEILKTPKEKLVELLKKVISNQKDLEKKINNLRLEIFKKSISDIISQGEEIGKIKIISYRIDDTDMDFLRNAIDLIKQKVTQAIITLGSSKEEKVYIAMGITDDIVKKGLRASELIKEISKIVSGSGGGRADLAQAGGNNPAKLNEALLKIKEIVKAKSVK